MKRALSLLLLAASPVLSPAAVDLDALWNFGDPAGSEARFRAALQSARTLGLREARR